VDVCPESCLRLVPLEQIEFPQDTREHIQRNEQLYAVELDDVAAEELGVITGSAMLKDETKCIRCGLCAARCPVNVITMEAYHWVVKSPTGLVPAQSLYPRQSVPKDGVTV
jgi:NAD-dependent dihydropyrimidine dehydrogenase PreA subunit